MKYETRSELKWCSYFKALGSSSIFFTQPTANVDFHTRNLIRKKVSGVFGPGIISIRGVRSIVFHRFETGRIENLLVKKIPKLLETIIAQASLNLPVFPGKKEGMKLHTRTRSVVVIKFIQQDLYGEKGIFKKVIAFCKKVLEARVIVLNMYFLEPDGLESLFKAVGSLLNGDVMTFWSYFQKPGTHTR
ncbi:MAG: hypothetical protein B6I30_02915 [Desulfobacteraceae bacterium 4572_187]|nr:MAG: hypothetical protein B6I30_02915 [Desulfobacteraceae bacterium 4572_187]